MAANTTNDICSGDGDRTTQGDYIVTQCLHTKNHGAVKVTSHKHATISILVHCDDGGGLSSA